MANSDGINDANEPDKTSTKSSSFGTSSDPKPATNNANDGDDSSDDGFIRVSHVRSIKATSAPNPNASPLSGGDSILAIAVAGGEGGNGSSHTNPSLADEEANEDDDEDDDDLGPGYAAMPSIGKSPYEPEGNAETGVELFQKMAVLLKEDETNDVSAASIDAVKCFGKNARCLVKTNALIEKSGIAYSLEWAKGNIRGFKVGAIPAENLILCLVSQRLVRASEQLLSGLSKDLEVSRIVNDALRSLELENTYRKVHQAIKNYSFTSRKRDMFKCAIFVARTWSCYAALSQPKLLWTEEVQNKVNSCLTMMEDHLADRSTKSRKKRKVSDFFAGTTEPFLDGAEVGSSQSSAQGSISNLDPFQSKKKRGRPRKNHLPNDATHTEQSHHSKVVYKDDPPDDDDSEVILLHSTSTRAHRPNGEAHDSNFLHPKRKPGRPRKHPLPTATTHPEESHHSKVVYTDGPLEKDATKIMAPPAPAQLPSTGSQNIAKKKKLVRKKGSREDQRHKEDKRPAATRNNSDDDRKQSATNHSTRVPSFSRLIHEFEETFNDMQQNCERMGRILEKLKARRDDLPGDEAAIRKEIVEDVQRALSNSLL